MTIAPHEASRPPTVNLENITDLDQAMRVCEYLALSDIVPQSLRGKAANVFVVYLTGRELGLSFAQALRSVYVPAGGQPQLRGSLLLAKIREAGHKYRWDYGEDGNSCTFWIKRDGEDEVHESFSLDDALLAGLVRKAANGDIIALSQGNRPLPWMQYRHDMLFWRAVARCANRVVPEIILGFDIAGSGEVQQQEAHLLQPAGPGQQPAETGQPASPPPAEGADAAELAGLDALGGGAAPPQGDEPAAGEPEPASPPPATPRHRQPAEAIAGDGNPRATKAAQAKVSDAFAALGWVIPASKQEILNACTVFCKRRIIGADRLSNKEATELAAQLGRIFRANKKDHHLIALSDAIDGWEHDWEEADPDAYERYKEGA